MEIPRRPWRRVGLAGTVAVVLALAVPGIAFGSQAGGGAVFPPSNTCVIPFLPCYIDLSISSGSHGNKETVTAAQFYPGEPFTVYFWSAATGAAAVGSGLTGTGSFTVSFPIPSDPVGSYTVFVTDYAGDNASASFQLTYLRANPDSGGVGNTTLLNGRGFLPDHSMKFQLHGMHVSPIAHCQTNRYGNFSGCRLTIPNVPSGATHLTATDGTYTARIGFVVS